jgi:hypothetical protein
MIADYNRSPCLFPPALFTLQDQFILVEGLIAGAVLGQEGQEGQEGAKSFPSLFAPSYPSCPFLFFKKPPRLRADRKMN